MRIPVANVGTTASMTDAIAEVGARCRVAGYQDRQHHHDSVRTRAKATSRAISRQSP